MQENKKVRKLGIGKCLKRWYIKLYSTSLTSYLLYKTFKIKKRYGVLELFNK